MKGGGPHAENGFFGIILDAGAFFLPRFLSKYEVQRCAAARQSFCTDFGDINDCSIVVRIVHGNNTFPFTGDAGWEAEHDMVDSL